MAKRKTLEEVRLEVKKKGFDLLDDEYINNQTKMTFKCKTGHEFTMRVGHLLQGHGCRECNKLKRSMEMRKSHDTFVCDLFNMTNGEYIVLEQYKSSNIKILFEHTSCRYKWKTTPNNILRGYGCPNCNGTDKKTLEEFKLEVDSLVGDDYEVLGSYLNSNTNIKMKHRICDTEWKVRPSHFIYSNSRCPKCCNYNNSIPMDKIREFLNYLSIKTDREKKFDKCKNKKMLPFDFYIDSSLLLEYDGQQHFNPVSIFGGKEAFLKTQHNDKIKNQYCIDNNIPLIRIPYWEFNNIEYILENVLKHYSLIESYKIYDKDIVSKYLVDEDWNHDEYIKNG